ncbi:MAG: tetratricopeptide repeat protein, partial [Magnetococcales bacterium]|nr:tetratricopeptide repeat protein [Magnetococcales bacterium]
LGKQALTKRDMAGALKQFLKAHQLAPKNANYLHNGALIAEAIDQKKIAFQLFRKGAALAAETGKQSDLQLYNSKITKLLNVTPAWINRALGKASQFKNKKAVGPWSAKIGQANKFNASGQLPAADKAAEEAVNMAKKSFGDNHLASFMSLRSWGEIKQKLGQSDKAEKLFKEAIAAATKTLEAKHPETIGIQTLLAELYESQLNFAEAQKVYKNIQTAFGNGLGEHHPNTLASSMNLARVMQNSGQYPAAGKLLDATCRTYLASFGPHHDSTAACLGQQGLAQVQLGDYPKAKESYQRAVKIFTAALPKGDARTLRYRMELADVERRQGAYKAAKSQLEALLEESDPKGNISFQIRASLAQVAEDLGDFPKAESLIKEVLEYDTASMGRNHPNTFADMNSLASVYQRQGRFMEAESLYTEALDRSKKALGEHHQTTLTIANNLGLIYEKQGLYDKAEPLFKNVVQISRKMLGEIHPVTMTNTNNLAMLHESQGNFDKAEPLYKGVIKHLSRQLGAHHPDTIAIVNNLGYLYLLQENYKEAGPRFEEVLNTWTGQLGEEHQKTLKGMNNLARVYHKTGRLDEAEKLFERALELRTKVLGEKHMDVMRSMHDLAVLYHSLKKHDKAAALLEKTLRATERHLGTKHPYTFEAVNSMGRLLEDRGDTAGAIKIMRKGFERRTQFLNRMLWVAGENAREGYVRLHRPELERYLSLLAREDTPKNGRAVLEVGLQRKGLLLKISSEIQQVLRFSDDPALAKNAEALTQKRKKLAALTLSGPTEETADRHLEVIHELEEQIDELERKLGHASKRFQRSIADISVGRLVTSLPDEAVLVDFNVFKENDELRLVAGLMRREDGEAIFGLVKYENLAEIRKMIKKYRELIQDEDADDDEVLEFGMDVYDQIWEPLEAFLGESEEIYLVPDGMLNILPFNALVTPDEEYMVRSVDLHILTSSRDLLPSMLPQAKGAFMTLAGPDYDTEEVAGKQTLAAVRGRRSRAVQMGLRGAGGHGMRGLKFDPLPGAEKEGRLIVDQARGSGKNNILYVKNDAQEEILKDMKEAPEVLHIATHGFFLKADDNLKKRLLRLQRGAALDLPPPGDNPLLRAGLAFAGINSNAPFLGEIDTKNDGVLTALEVLNLNLTGTRLAVLSACETGLGEIHEGEGVYGLRRAFQEAGVESVINSLWEVSDAGTQALMIGLYKRLLEGKNAHQALRESQMEMMDSAEWGYPYIWSAFFMVGR